MKGLILAAGRGSRLLPISATRPKHTLPVGGVPIIMRAVQALREAGIDDIGIVTSASSEAALRDVTLGSGHLTFIRQAEALGTGDATLCARTFLEGQPTLLYLGDNLFGDSLRPVMDALDGADAVIGVKRVPNPQAYGVAVVEGGLLRRLVEKPRTPESDLAACGVFAFQPRVLDDVADLPPSTRGEIEFPEALTAILARGGRVRALEFTGFWSDAGTPRDLLDTNAYFLAELRPRVQGQVVNSQVTGTVVVEPGAVMENCTLTGPVWIGPHARVSGSAVGPFVSIGAHSHVSGASIRDSLVDAFTRVQSPERALSRAVVGRHALIGPPGEEGLQLVVGDRSVVRL